MRKTHNHHVETDLGAGRYAPLGGSRGTLGDKEGYYMMSCVRIAAEHSGDSGDPQDKRWKLVFDAVMQGDKLKNQRCFGLAEEVEDNQVERWPCLIEPPGKRSAHIDFGPFGEPRYEPINVFEKRIAVGELFTRGGEHDVFTYRIISVTPLI